MYTVWKCWQIGSACRSGSRQDAFLSWRNWKGGKGEKGAHRFCQRLLMLLPDWAEGVIKPLGKEDLEACPLSKKKALLQSVFVRVCRPLCASGLNEWLEWVEVMIPPDGKTSIWTCWWVGVCYLCAKITDTSTFSSWIFKCLVALLGSKTTSYVQRSVLCEGCCQKILLNYE